MSESVFTKEWLADGRVVCYRFISTGSEAAQVWYAEVSSLFGNWDTRQPLLMLVDLSQPNNFLSAEALSAARQVSHLQPDVPGKTALLIDGSQPAQNVNALVDHVLAGTRERKIFADQAEAVAWLLEG